jgi:hypothetical protein
MCLELGSEDVARSARMREQLMDGDLRGELLVRVIGDVRDERRFELHLSRLHELQDGGGGEHLVHGAESKARVERVCDVSLAIGEAVRGHNERLAAAREEHGTRKTVGVGILIEASAKPGE